MIKRASPTRDGSVDIDDHRIEQNETRQMRIIQDESRKSEYDDDPKGKRNPKKQKRRPSKATLFIAARNLLLSLAASFALWHLALGRIVRSSSGVGIAGPRSASGPNTLRDDSSGSSDGDGSAAQSTNIGGLRSAPAAVAPTEDTTDASDDDFCTLYMAPSTIGPNAGFGIFTAKLFESGDIIKLHEGPSIPVTDTHQISDKAPHLKVLDDKWWAELKGMPNAMRFEAEEVVEYVAGFGSLANYHPYLQNLDPFEPVKAINDLTLDRQTSPGAGASSAYTGKDFFANRDIVAGEELFLDYGESYFEDYPSVYENIPRQSDYFDTSAMLSKFYDELGQAIQEGTAMTTDEAYTKMTPKEKQIVEKMFYSMKQGVAAAYSERSASLLPATYEEVTKIAEEANEVSDPIGSASGDAPNEGRVRFALAREMSTHHATPSWLRQHGLCLDNIIRKPSTIPEAGEGGFAARPLKSGEMIVPVPLYHVANRDFLGTYPIHIDQETGRFYRNHTRLEGPSELLLNYCFGHDESSLLLCPITSVMSVNHCSMRGNGGQCGTNTKKGPNAKIQWGTKWHPETARWLKKSIKDISDQKDRVLNLEMVATRDIDEGEEIVIDYGQGWEDAWEDHIAKWSPPAVGSGFEEHKSMTRLNEKMADLEPTGDLRSDHSPSGDVLTGCWYWPENREDRESESDDGSAEEEDDDDSEESRTLQESKDSSWKDLSDKEILASFANDGSHFKSDQNYVDNSDFWPCSIVSKDEKNKNKDWDDGEPTYTVRIFPSKSHPYPDWADEGEPMLLTNYPRASIRYFHKPYRSDLHLPGSFRRFIGIDDALFPENWKDRKEQDSKDESFNIGDRVVFSVRQKERVGIVLGYDPDNGYEVVSVRSEKVRTGIQAKEMKLDVHLEELRIDPFYA